MVTSYVDIICVGRGKMTFRQSTDCSLIYLKYQERAIPPGSQYAGVKVSSRCHSISPQGEMDTHPFHPGVRQILLSQIDPKQGETEGGSILPMGRMDWDLS